MGTRPRLPIDEILPALEAQLARPGANAVVLAPPGAGKTTGLPLALLAAHSEASQVTGEILVAQPRRLAARMAASLSAKFHASPLGQAVGYRVRYDAKASEATRLCYLTDGLLLRRLREDATLPGVSTVVLDEFHERKLDGDLCLALLRRAQLDARPDLQIVVMSATLDPGPVAKYLDAPCFESQGRAFEVSCEYAPLRERRLEAAVLRALTRRVDAVQQGSGDPGNTAVTVQSLGHVLVFLPGAAEIRRCEQALRGYCAHHDLRLLTLHGELERSRQDLAVGPSERPKVILSTNVAETSVTIDEVATVIDSGLARVARHDPWTGLGQLELRPISRASAQQRAGRAGRTRPGHCVRLYARADYERRPPREAPEVMRAELSSALFELASAGVREAEKFAWFEPPPPAATHAAQRLLRGLGATQPTGELSERGRAMRRWPLHPRLARVMVDAQAQNCAHTAAKVCALLSERPLRRAHHAAPRPDDADVLFEMAQLDRSSREAPQGLDPKGVDAVRRAVRSLERRLPRTKTSRDRTGETRDARVQVRRILLGAFFDKIARVRTRDGGLEAQSLDGRAVPLAPACVVREDPFLLALQVRAGRSHGKAGGPSGRARPELTSACAVELDWILEDRLDDLEARTQAHFDRERERVTVHESLCLGALELERNLVKGHPEELAAALFAEAAESPLRRFCDVDALEGLRARVEFAESAGFSWSDGPGEDTKHKTPPPAPFSEDHLRAVLEQMCAGRSSFAELRKADLLVHARADLGPDLNLLDRVAPVQVKLASGRSLRVTYAPGQSPSVSSYLQDFFGSARGPALAQGRVPLVLHLLAPNRRDVQVTTDLEGFWERHYPTLRKQLMRRYPKHPWPEDPRTAKPPAPRPRRGPRKGKGKGKGKR